MDPCETSEYQNIYFMDKPNDMQQWIGWGSLQVPLPISLGMDALVTSFGYNMLFIKGISWGEHVKTMYLETYTTYFYKQPTKSLNGVLHRLHGPCEWQNL